tara:strand:+ start:333 stop:680 length:348 start_codon:yes stop_codon:yes gene_type:complete
MVVMWVLTYLVTLGNSVQIIRQTQRSCAALLIVSEQGLHEILQLKYLTMLEAKRSEQNIVSQKYIDQMNLSSIKDTIMRNYVGSIPDKYQHLLEYRTWEELEVFVETCTQENKEE